MAEADDSQDHIVKPKKKWKREKVGNQYVNVRIKEHTPYETSYGSIITGEYKKKKSRFGKYTNIQKKRKKKNYSN